MENQEQNKEEKTMTAFEAIAAMQEGKKVTHPHFEDGEWATMRNGAVVTEDNVVHPNFWAYRTDESWRSGWVPYIETQAV